VAELSEREPRRLVRVRNGAGWEGEIEAGWLKPVIKSPREIRTLRVRLEDLRYLIFMPPDDVREAMEKGRKKLLEYLREKHPRAFNYIQWGEKQGYQERPTCRSREWWWDVGVKGAQILILRATSDRPALYFAEIPIFHDQTFYSVLPYVRFSEEIVAALFNAAITNWLNRELVSGASSMLGGGASWTAVYEASELVGIKPPILPPSQRARLISAFERLAQREVRSIFEELGFAICRERGCQNPEHPYEFVNPKALTLEQVRKASPDRFELDSVVFDILGLTDEERLEVYKAVADLVKSRLTKARSV